MKELSRYAQFALRLAVLVAALATGVFAGPAELSRARELYNRTEFDAAVRVLQPVQNKNAADYLLMGQSYYMQGDPKKASETLQKALALSPGDSNVHLWLGRAFGRRAETSSFVTAPGYATKAREEFEKAVQLNPRNLEAVSDLFEYYLEAPGFLGGGFDKASALAGRLGEINPADGHWAQARLAEKRKQFGTAEQQLRRAMDLAPRQVGRVIDLAKFFSKTGRYQESEETFRLAESIAPDSPKVMFERASAYIHAGRNLQQAKQLLQKYLQTNLTPDDPPRKEAQSLLKQVSST